MIDTDSELHRDALAPEALETIERLGARGPGGSLGEFYLAGGAALSLRLGHRRARDLDLMSGTERLASANRRDLLADLLAEESTTRVETARDGYLFVRWPGQVAIRFFWYPYPLVGAVDELHGLAVASLLDLSLMKLGAVISRGTRRDFVDLAFACKALPLDDVLARAGEKFGHVGDFALQAWKALADVAAAEDEPMPKTTPALDWDEVKSWARDEARRGGSAALAPPKDNQDG